jgi:hypothetical protein
VLAYEDVTWKGGFARFNQHYLALRLALEHQQQQQQYRLVPQSKSITLSELLEGARVGQPVAQYRVLLNASSSSLGTVASLSKHYPSDEGDEDSEGGLATGVVYLNAPGAPFDLVTRLAMAGEDEGSGLTLLHECKHTASGGAKGARLSVKLVEEAIKKARAQCAENSSRPKVAVMVMSNRSLPQRLLKSWDSAPLVLVTRENAVDYFGSSLAYRFLGDVPRSDA